MSFDTLFAHYNWLGTLVFLATIFAVTKAAKYVAFRQGGLKRMLEWNQREDRVKRDNPKWKPVAKGQQRVGMWLNGGFLLLICPFIVTLESMPWWRFLVDAVVILMVYDLFYYLVHRFLFHGPILKRVHGLHHQARDPSYVDALYVHSTETLIGLGMFVACLSVYGFLVGGMHAVSIAITYFIYVQLNSINHCKFDLDYFPFRTINYLTTKHAIHHENMNMGNYASITPLYDWMFGTLD